MSKVLTSLNISMLYIKHLETVWYVNEITKLPLLTSQLQEKKYNT